MTIDIVIPTYNEEGAIEQCVQALRRHLTGLPFDAHITIADNASTDSTPQIADRLAKGHDDVSVIHVPRKGRGIALKTAWGGSSADVLVYMDVDLSTNLNALLPLVAPLLSGHSDLAIGSRLSHSSRVLRGSKREVISRCYNLLLRGTLGTEFGDAQCGFKAIRGDAARWLLPLVEDDGWFFDTELLVLAERAGLRIYEVPVDWVDDPDSRVEIRSTAIEDVRGIRRLGWNLSRGRIPLDIPGVPPHEGERTLLSQLVRFLGVGLVSTIAYALVFLLVRTQATAGAANVVALLSTTVLNTAANRLITFGVHGRARVVRHQLQGLVLLGAGLVVTTTALWLSSRAGVHGNTQELGVLTGANLLVTVGRFAAFRLWVFRTPRGLPNALRPAARTGAPDAQGLSAMAHRAREEAPPTTRADTAA